MKKIFFAVVVILSSAAFSCEKAENELSQSETVTLKVPTPTFAQTQKAPILQVNPLEKSSLVEIIRDVNIDLVPNTWSGYFINRADLPDPLLKKLAAMVTKTNTANVGNPNLYIYGYDNETQVFRLIRSSTKPSTEADYMTFRSTDLKFAEDRIYVGVYCFDYPASVRMQTLRRDVDCKEYPSAEQIGITLYQPVTGCDGVRYSNSLVARNAGITKWYAVL